jgi:hypothetical protein
MAYLSLAGVLSEMNQAEAMSRGMLDLGTISPSYKKTEEEEVEVEEEPSMATPPVPTVNIQDLINQMMGAGGQQ